MSTLDGRTVTRSYGDDVTFTLVDAILAEVADVDITDVSSLLLPFFLGILLHNNKAHD